MKSDANGDVSRGFNLYLIWRCSMYQDNSYFALIITVFHSSSDMDLSSLLAGLFNG